MLERGLMAGLIINQRGRRKNKRGGSMHGNIPHTHTRTQTLTCKYTLTCVHTLTNTHGLTCTCTHALTNILPSTHTLCVHKKIIRARTPQAHLHSHIHAYKYSLSQSLTHVCTQTYTCTHFYLQIQSCLRTFRSNL